MKNDDDYLNVYDVEQKQKNLGEEKKKEKTLSRNVINTSVPPQGVRCVIAKKKYEPKGR